MKLNLVLIILVLGLLGPAFTQEKPMRNTSAAPPAWLPAEVAGLKDALLAKYGESERARMERGLQQVSQYWRAEDGDAAEFRTFVSENFAGTPQALDTMFTRFEHLLQEYDGHMTEVVREFRTQSDLDLGTIAPYDDIFAGYDPTAHFMDDAFRNKLAFVVLLNFPLTTLEERLNDGPNWSRGGSGRRCAWPSASPSAFPARSHSPSARRGRG